MKREKKAKAANSVFKLSPLVLAMAGYLPGSVSAGIVLNPNDEKRPGLSSSANETPVININNPDAQGLSHNRYQEFDVNSNGLILNNSMQDGVSKIGGFVIKNNQLQQESKVILNEVTGAKGSYLNGAIEVFGRKADVIIANENGITVNGVSTINAQGLTLSTGRVNVDEPGQVKLAVERGAINVEGQGINTDGLSYFDLISRSAQLKAQIAGEAELKVVTGLNDYDTRSRTHQVRSASADDTPQVAIAGTALGSMYGSRIQLISTESGAGVVHSGSLVGENGIEISADGDIQLVGLKAGQGNVRISGNSISLAKNADTGVGGINANGDVVLTALQNMTLAADTLSEQGIIRINASSLLQSAASLLAKNGSGKRTAIDAITIKVNDSYTLSGQLYALDNSGNKIANASIRLRNGKYEVLVNNQAIPGAQVVSDASLESLNGNISISAGSLQNQQGVMYARKGELAISLDGALLNNGLVQAQGSISLHGKQFKNQGIFNTTQDLLLTLGSLENSGALYGQNIEVATQEFGNSGVVLAENGDLKLAVSGDKESVNSGVLQGDNNRITTAGKLVNQGDIAAGEQLNISSSSIANAGQIVSQQDITLTAAESIDNLGKQASIVAQQKLDLHDASDEKNLTINNLDGGVLQSSAGSITVQHVQALNNSGSIMARETVAIEHADRLDNQHGLIQANTLQLSHLGQLTNQQEGTLFAHEALLIDTVDHLENNQSLMQSQGELRLENIQQLINNAGQLEADGRLTLSNLTTLENRDGGEIASYYDSLLMKSIGNLNNLLNATLSARQNVEMTAVDNIHNAENSTIKALGNIDIRQAQQLENHGQILADLALIVNNLDRLVNDGNDGGGALLQGLNIIFSDIREVINQNQGMIIAQDKLSLAKIGTLLNRGAGWIQSQRAEIEADEITNQDYGTTLYGGETLNITAGTLNNIDEASIVADGKVSLQIDTLENGQYSNLIGNSLDIDAKKLHNDGIIKASSASGASTIIADSLHNDTGKIISQGSLTLNTEDLANSQGYISGNKLLEVNLTDDFYSSQTGTLYSAEKLAITTDGDITIDRKIESVGSLYLDAKNIFNKSAAFSANSIFWNAVNVINEANATIFAMKDVTLNALQEITNYELGNILSQGTMSLKADTITNHAGIIRAEGDMWLDASLIKNESTYTGTDWDYSSQQIGSGETTFTSGLYWETYTTAIALPGLTSDIRRDKLAEISSGGDLYINQNHDGAASLINEGGLIQSAGDMTVRGDITNAPRYVSQSLEQYLKNALEYPIQIAIKVTDGGWSDTEYRHFYNLYSLLEFLFNGGGSQISGHKMNWSSSEMERFRKYSLDSFRLAANKNQMFDKVMKKIFGEQWKAASFSSLADSWLVKNYPGELARSQFYFLPSEKATMSAGGNFTHSGGALNNGIASDVAGDINKNALVNVDVDGQQISTLEQGYEVTFNKKNVAEIAMGVSTLPKINELININGMYQKSQDFLNSIGNGPNVGGEAINKVIPVYETRPEMINQDDFYGSDYFFEQMGYQPEQPVLVIGDNYFISELIRRQLNESVGNYFQVKYNVEGADLVKTLFDNVADVVNDEAFSGMTVGKKLTSEQVSALDKDIVWFVYEQIDGMDVLVPHVYLAQSSLQDIEQGSVTGAAAIHAGGDINVDASKINNNNAMMSAGNNISLAAEENINSISSGMSGGITAGNNLSLISEHGDITNSGSQLTAGNDMSLSAAEGEVDLIASVGRDNEANQKIGVYDDDLNAGHNINIIAKEINVTAVDLNAGASADSTISLTSTEGNVSFNDTHEISATYDSTFEQTGFMSTRSTETTTVDAVAKGATVNTGGKFIVNAKQDVEFHGGEYNADSGDIKAGNDIITTTSQDYHVKEEIVKESSFELSLTTDVPSLDKTTVNVDSLDGSSVEQTSEYESAGSDSSLTNNNGKRPGAAPTAGLSNLKAGLKTTVTTSKDSSVTNKNAAFNFTNQADMNAGNTLDIGGMDLTVSDEGTANLSAKNIISTKYNDVEKHEESYSEEFIGLKAELHSSVVDTANKYQAILEKSEQEDMDVNVGMTTAQVAGDVTNAVFNDIGGGSVSMGWSKNTESKSSVTTKENINNLSGGKINISTTQDTTLKGVVIDADEVNINTGGDFSLTAAESTYSETTTNSSHNAGVSVGAGVAPTGAGVGVSVDYSGSNGRSETESVTHTQSVINANQVTISSGNDVTLHGANINAGQADLNIAGDLSIESVQDHSHTTASSENWGVSVGAAVSTSGVLPTFAAHGGGGSESHLNDTTVQQSGIHTSDELNVKAGGDINLAGSHLISDNSVGGVEAGGAINVSDITDVVDSSGLYGGGGGGMSYKGTPMVNGYVDKLDTIKRKEDQHSTINVGINKGEVNGTLNTDVTQMSTVTEDTKEAGNNISFTLGPIKKPGGKSGSADIKNTHNSAPSPAKPAQPAAPSPAKPAQPAAKDPAQPAKKWPTVQPAKPIIGGPGSSSAPGGFSGQGSVKPVANAPGGGTVSDVTRAGKTNAAANGAAKPVHSEKGKTSVASDHAASDTVNSVPSPAKPAQPAAKDSAKPAQPAAKDPAQPAKQWPTVQPAKPIIGGPGSSSAPGGFSGQGSVKPVANAPGGGSVSDVTRAAKSSQAAKAAAVQQAASGQPAAATPAAGGQKQNAALNTATGVPALGTQPGVSGVFKTRQTGSDALAPAKAWPAVQTKPAVTTSLGSSSHPGLFSGKGTHKPAVNAGVEKQGEPTSVKIEE